MSINSLNKWQSPDILPTRPASDGPKLNPRNSLPAGTKSSVDSTASATHISPSAELFSKLKQLALQDPEQFKEIAGQISEDLHAQAETGAAKSGALLEKYASDFAEAARTGDVTLLTPPALRDSASAPTRHLRGFSHPHWSQGHADSEPIFSSILNRVDQALSASAKTEPS